jgi:hypothetical protein
MPASSAARVAFFKAFASPANRGAGEVAQAQLQFHAGFQEPLDFLSGPAPERDP